jgi:Mrp family chromosome partitioning ATPase
VPESDPDAQPTLIFDKALQPQQAALVLRQQAGPPVPYQPPRALDPMVVQLLDPDSEQAACFRLLRDNLVAKNAPRVIAVSSGDAGDGKTTCAVNLALAMSELPSARVMLVEGTFSSPALAGVFRIDATTPLDPALNAAALSPYRIVRIARGLDAAVLVQQPGQPPAAFNSQWFETVLEYLSNAGYDRVVIDAPTLDGSPFATQVVAIAKGTLLTARSHATTARTLRRAAEQIPEGRALGVTLMD